MRVGESSIELELMIHGEPDAKKRPLLIVNPIELPLPPSPKFCDLMSAAGYQVYFVRRPGFGRTPSLPKSLMTRQEIKNKSGIAAEAAVLKILIDELRLKDVILLGVGTSNSVCMRVAQLSSAVTFTVFSNPLFHPGIWDVIRPEWLRRIIRQTVMTRSGLMIAVRGLKAILRRDEQWFYGQFAQKSRGDLAYIKENRDDFKAAGRLLSRMDPKLYFYELCNALIEDTRWNPETLSNLNAAILSGVETTENWKQNITVEAERLGLLLQWAPSGDLFVAYASPDTLLATIAEHTARVESV
jgi:pimeloyl-ACP methyl ester carboxylesterase